MVSSLSGISGRVVLGQKSKIRNTTLTEKEEKRGQEIKLK